MKLSKEEFELVLESLTRERQTSMIGRIEADSEDMRKYFSARIEFIQSTINKIKKEFNNGN